MEARCDVSRRSVQRILAEPVPTLDEVRADRLFRCSAAWPADDAMVARVRALLEEDHRNAHIRVIEGFRRAKE